MSSVRLIIYVGDQVVRLGEAGIFQQGTCAYVSEALARRARELGGFQIEGDPEPAAASPRAAAEEAPAPRIALVPAPATPRISLVPAPPASPPPAALSSPATLSLATAVPLASAAPPTAAGPRAPRISADVIALPSAAPPAAPEVTAEPAPPAPRPRRGRVTRRAIDRERERDDRAGAVDDAPTPIDLALGADPAE